MQHTMNYGYHNRGFGGQPQPQRQGGRRGNRNFGNSRFQPQNGQRNPNQNAPSGGQPANAVNVQPAKVVESTPPKNTVTQPAIQNNDVPKKIETPQVKPAPEAKAEPKVTPPQNQVTTANNNQNQNQQNNSFGVRNQQSGNFGPDKKQVSNFGPGNNQGRPAANAGPGNNQGNRPAANAGPGNNQGNRPVVNTGPGNNQGNRPAANNGPDNRQNSNFGPNNKPGGGGGFVPGNKPNANHVPVNKPGDGPGNRPPVNFGNDTKPVDHIGNRGRQGGNFAPDIKINENDGNRNRSEGNYGPGNKTGGFGPGNKQNDNFNQRNRQGGNFAPGNRQEGSGPKLGAAAPRPPAQVKRERQMIADKLRELQGPLTDLPPLEQTEVKFNGRSRLYIGNLPDDITEQDVLELFGAYGETAELFINTGRNFGFIKMDYRTNAERAKRELDGTMKNGRPIRVRFAPHNSAIRVKNLTPFVSNELLYRAFEIFGKIERAYVKVDERGKSLGEGVVEYARKPSALAAIRNCTESCFFLTSSLRPVIVELYEEPDELDGYQEKNLPKRHPDFIHARELGPRFAEMGGFEHEYGTRWKQLHELHRQKEEALRSELVSEEEKLEAQMEYAKYEHETELLREQLRQREQDRERQKRSWEMVERAADERRETDRTSLLRQEEEMTQRMRLQEEELRRRQQENTLFVQAQRLNSMLDRQEQGIFEPQPQQADGAYMDQYGMGRGFDEGMPQSQRWDGPLHPEDFPNKRRRF